MNEYKFTIIGRDATKAAFKGVQVNMRKVRSAVNSTQVKIAGLAGAGGIGLLTSRSLEFNDAQAKTADRLGFNIEKLSGYGLAAEITGSSQENLNKSLDKMNKNLGELSSRGIGTAKPALDALGLSIEDIKNKSPEEQIELISEEFKGLASQAEKAFVAQTIFGRGGAELIPLLEQGADGLAEMQFEADALGITMNRVDAAKLEAANDAMTKGRRAIDGIGNRLTVKLAPIIEFVANRFVGLAKDGDRMTKIIDKGFGFVSKAAGVFADGLRGVEIILRGLEVASIAFENVVVKGFGIIVRAAFNVGRSIVKAVVVPLRGAIKLAAKFSDDAKDVLKAFDNATNLADPAFLRNLDEAGERTGAKLDASTARLKALFLEELPSAKIDRKISEIFERAEQKAQEVTSNIRGGGPVIDLAEDGKVISLEQKRAQREAEREVEREQRERDRLQARLIRLDEGYETELEQLRRKHADELALIDENEQAVTDAKINAEELRQRINDDFKQKELALEQATAGARKAIQADSLQKIANLALGNSKKLFKIQQAAAVAQIALTVPPAVLETYRNNGGWPWGILPALAMAAEGASQLAAVKNQSFNAGSPSFSTGGGGGQAQTPNTPAFSANDLSNTIGAPGGTQSQVPANVIFFNVQGDNIGDSTDIIADRLKGKLNTEGYDLIESDSANGQRLAARFLEMVNS